MNVRVDSGARIAACRLAARHAIARGHGGSIRPIEELKS
jgi:hypothetical protein